MRKCKRYFSSWTQGSLYSVIVGVLFIFTSQLCHQASPSPWPVSPSSINRLISTGVKLLRSLLFLRAMVCFIIGCLFTLFPSHMKAALYHAVCTLAASHQWTLQQLWLALFLIRQPSGGFLMGLMTIALHCSCICALMSECISRWTYTEIHACTHTKIHIHPFLCGQLSVALLHYKNYVLWIKSSFSCNYYNHIESFNIPC